MTASGWPIRRRRWYRMSNTFDVEQVGEDGVVKVVHSRNGKVVATFTAARKKAIKWIKERMV